LDDLIFAGFSSIDGNIVIFRLNRSYKLEESFKDESVLSTGAAQVEQSIFRCNNGLLSGIYNDVKMQFELCLWS